MNLNPKFIAEVRTRLRQAVEAYAASGRRFEVLDAKALEKRFVVALKAWCTYPTHPDTGRELNDVSCEYMSRQLDVPDEALLEELEGFLPIGKGCMDTEPMTAIAVVILRESAPPGMPVLYVPRWQLLLCPRDDRHGDYLRKVWGPYPAEERP
jgi:hypothetical protein